MRGEIGSSTGCWRILVGTLPGLAVLVIAVLLAGVGLAGGTACGWLHRLRTEGPRNYLGVVNGSGPRPR